MRAPCPKTTTVSMRSSFQSPSSTSKIGRWYVASSSECSDREAASFTSGTEALTATLSGGTLPGADALGCTQRYLGLHPREQERLAECLVALGCESVPVNVTDLKWEKRIWYADALGQIRGRLFAEFWCLPGDAYNDFSTTLLVGSLGSQGEERQ
jgi:hypothetical protein